MCTGEESIGSSQSGKEMQQSDNIYVCIPAKSVTDYVPVRERYSLSWHCASRFANTGNSKITE